MGDLLFLHAFVNVLAPDRVVEIGTLSGFSAAVIADAVAQHQRPESESVIVDTIDLSQVFTTGTADEEDVIVGGTAYFTGAQGTYRVGSVPEDQQASKVKLLSLKGVVCLNGS